METPPASATGAINLGVAAYEAGHGDEARALFSRALHLDPERELAWLWFAAVATDPAEQRYCLGRARAINPETPGLRRLAQLGPGPETVPPELRNVDQPPLPPGLASVAPVSLLLESRPVRAVRPGPTRFTRSSRPATPTEAAAPETAPAGEEPARAGRDAAPLARWRGWLVAGLVLAVVAAIVAVVFVRPPGELSGEPYTIAYVGPLTGQHAYIGTEQLEAVELAIDTLNQQGGIAGRPVRVLTFDDQDDPELAAARAEEIVANDDILLVIGHHRSTTSLVAAPIYEAAGLAAISPSATVDALTESNPWYFRTVLPSRSQGMLVAAYAQHALGFDRASVITVDDPYSETLARAFVAEFEQAGTIAGQWTVDLADREASIAAIIEELAATDDPGIVFLPLGPDDARQVLLQLRRSGSTLPVIGGDAFGYRGFARLFEGEPEEEIHPGYFSNGVYAVSTIIYDGLGGTALEFAQQFIDRYGRSPEWFGAKAHDAAELGMHALAALDAAETPPETPAARRTFIRDALAATDSLATAVEGISGPLYFNDEHTVPQMLSFGLFDRGDMLNAPLQYRPVTEPEKFDLAADAAAGLLFELDGLTYRQYRVAYVGVDINEVANLDVRAQTFDADFYLWLRYAGDERAEDVFFTNTTDEDFELPEPLDRADDGDVHYVMFRVQNTFAVPMDFRNYPWDTHRLRIGLQNESLNNNDIVYVPDPANLRQPQAERMQSAVDFTRPFNRVPSWDVDGVGFVQGSALARSTMPDRRTGAPEYDRFSTYQVQMDYSRVIRPFLIKNLLPLALLALVTYISLFFSPESASTRIGFSITSILTTSVLLQSVSTNLPEIGYTVAIEWGYYIYIGLSAVLVLINIVIDRWYKQKRYAAVRGLDLFARILYPTVILFVVAAYFLAFA